jgi:hypothetical protein
VSEIAVEAPAEAAVAGPAGPYPGLRPFLSSERDIFFGREQMIDDVLVRLERRMVVVHGTSGCGKSSLIAAGVLPLLRQRQARCGRKLAVDTFSPGRKPMSALVEKLREMCGSKDSPASLKDIYRAISDGAQARANVSRLAAEAGLDQLCIVVDQFEELFRFAEEESSEEARNFAELLVQLAGYGAGVAQWWQEERAPSEAPPNVITFILTMRSEFLGNCARYPGLAEAINETQYLLPNMARADLVRAIRNPAEVFDGSVDHDLAERIADDAQGEEDSLPLVQHALLQLWLKSENRTLTIADYEREIDVCTQCEKMRRRAPLGAILAAHADYVLAAVAGNDRARTAAEFMFRALTKKDNESRAIRCPQKFSRLVKVSGVPEDEARRIVDAFRGEGVSFLTPYMSNRKEIAGGDTIDISHEALIRTWPRMSDTAIDADTLPIGWVEREAQSAMLWRWIAVQADLFRSSPQAYLDLATNLRTMAWFQRIRIRPESVRPYLLRPMGEEDITKEPEWRAVEHLLTESLNKTRLDRLLIRWSKLGGALFTLVTVALGVALSTYVFMYHWEAFDFKMFKERAAGREEVTSRLQVGNTMLASADQRAGTAAAAQTETVDERIAAAATAGGSFINTPNGQGYIWIGTVSPEGGLDGNLRGRGDRPVDPLARHQAGASFWTIRNTIVRGGRPGTEAGRTSVGIVARGALVRMVERTPVSIDVDGRTEFWAKVQLAQTGLPRLRFALANVPDGLRRRMLAQLGQMGYRAGAAAPLDAAGRADVVYCLERNRSAAVQLATTITRWIGQQPNSARITVTPLRGDSCEGIAANELIVLLDLAPPPAETPSTV